MRECLHTFEVLRPIVQGGRVKIRTIWPNQCMHFGVNTHLIEQRQILERTGIVSHHNFLS
jgi:hypothetical protein